MKIYNSLTRKKEAFSPLEEGKVKMYACGITVSGEAHIGHAFQALIYDIFRKFLQKQGYEVTYARNYTDVDDKIIAKSRETGIPADEYARMMIEKINGVMRKFNVDDPTLWLKATENIGNIIDFVQRLIEKGHAYPAENGDVYFDVATFPAYGQLSGRSTEDALDGVRVEYYGSMVPVSNVANISVPDARTIAITPWEKAMFKAIEKAIINSEVGITPENNGEIIRLSIPPLTEDRRKALVKQCKAEAENAKVSVRNARRDAIDGLKKAIKQGMSEDIEKDAEATVQKIHDKYLKRIDDIFAAKEKEILTV